MTEAPRTAQQPGGPPAWHRPARLGALAGIGTVALAVGNPNTTHIPLCPLKFATGLDCPFCGSLRAVHALAHLDVVGAASHNLVFTVAAPFLVVAWAAWLHRSLTGRGRPPIAPRWTTWVAIGVLAAFMVLRNLPTFSWLGSA